MEFMRRVYVIFRRLIWDDMFFNEGTRKLILKLLNTAIYEAQAEVYEEVTRDDA